MNYRRGDIINLNIFDLAFGGAGVGKLKMEDADGEFVVFVEGTVPGDQVEAKFTKIKKKFGEARLHRIVKASANRIAPRCKHFGVCGGCSLQFLEYKNQLSWKQKMVEDALRGIGGFQNLSVEPIIGCASSWFYRNKMEFSFSPSPPQTPAVPLKPNASLLLGLHKAHEYASIFDLEECFLESETAVEIVHAVREWAVKSGIRPYDARRHEGVLKNLVIREGKNTGEIMVNLIANGRDFSAKEDFKKFITERFPKVTSLYYTAVTVQRGFRTVIEEHHLAGKKTLTEELRVQGHTLQFEILPQAFFQTNTKQAEVLYEKILEFGGIQKSEGAKDQSVLDLFCGTGTIGMFFAKTGTQVIGVDSSPPAIENAKENAAQNGLTNIEFQCVDTDKFLTQQNKLASLLQMRRKPHLLASLLQMRLDLLITDPPRAGILPKSLEKILEFAPPRWIYVSCNPTTLARDLKIAAEHGYKIEKVQPVDMFPHTYHVECVCLLNKLT